MAKPTDRPIYALTWEDKNPSRYDYKPLELSRWADLAKSRKTARKKIPSSNPGRKAK